MEGGEDNNTQGCGGTPGMMQSNMMGGNLQNMMNMRQNMMNMMRGGCGMQGMVGPDEGESDDENMLDPNDSAFQESSSSQAQLKATPQADAMMPCYLPMELK